MTVFIDSHAHLADPAFDADRDAVIERARAAGAAAVVCIGESIGGCRTRRRDRRGASRLHLLHRRRPSARRRRVRSDARSRRAFESSSTRGAVAIGECGLDSHYDHSPRELQRRAFAAQLALARELDRPVVVHTREAEDDTRAMVVEAAARRRSRRAALLHRSARARRGGARRRLVRVVQRHRHVQEVGRRRRSFGSCPTIDCSSNPTRRISRPCRIAESATSRRGLASRSRASPPRGASIPTTLGVETARNAARLFGLSISLEKHS